MKIQKRQIAGMNLVYKFYSFDYFLDAMERLGYESIELLPNAPHFYVPDLSASDMSAIRQKIHDHHLTTICYTPDQCSYPVNISYNSEVGRRRSIQSLARQIEVCSYLGSGQMLLTSGYGYFDEPKEQAWARMVDSLGQLSRKAEKEGVVLVLEPIRTDETNLVTDLPSLKRAIREVDSPNLKGMLDTSPMYYAGESIAQYAQELGDDLWHIHLIDGRPAGHLAWGDGIFPLDQYMREIEQAGYSRYMTLEFTSAEYYNNPNPAMEQSMNALRPYLE